jgi:hypothetical protein
MRRPTVRLAIWHGGTSLRRQRSHVRIVSGAPFRIKLRTLMLLTLLNFWRCRRQVTDSQPPRPILAGVGHLKWTAIPKKNRTIILVHKYPLDTPLARLVTADPVTQMVSGVVDYRIGTNEGHYAAPNDHSDRPVWRRTERPELLGASEIAIHNNDLVPGTKRRKGRMMPKRSSGSYDGDTH